jgi:hypothetical protein
MASCIPLLRRLKTLFRVSSAAAVAISFVACPPAFADQETTKLSAGNSDLEFVVGDPSREEDLFSFNVFLQGDTAGEVKIELVDVVGSGPKREYFEPRSIPESLGFAIELVSPKLDYLPNGKTQEFKVSFAPVSDFKPGFYSGEIRISFAPAVSSGGASSAVGIVRPLIVTSYGLIRKPSEDGFLATELRGHQVSSLGAKDIADSLLPDLTNVVTRGPVSSLVKVVNPGTYPNFTTIRWEFYDGENLLAAQELETFRLGGGKSKTAEISAVFEDKETGRQLDLLPTFGMVKLKILISSELAGEVTQPKVYTYDIWIVPWKLPTLIIGLALLAGYLVFKRRRRSRIGESVENRLVEHVEAK